MLTRKPCARSAVDMSFVMTWMSIVQVDNGHVAATVLEGPFALSPFLPSSPPPPSLHSTSHKSELSTPSTHPSALFHHRDWAHISSTPQHQQIPFHLPNTWVGVGARRNLSCWWLRLMMRGRLHSPPASRRSVLPTLCWLIYKKEVYLDPERSGSLQNKRGGTQ